MSNASSPTALPATAGREWLADCHCADPVLRLLATQGWNIVSDPSANVHCTSPDGKVYVGFLPETLDAVLHGDLWRIEVNDTSDGASWTQTFHAGTPALAIAGFLAALIATPARACATCH
jgi:hypothetical protein